MTKLKTGNVRNYIQSKPAPGTYFMHRTEPVECAPGVKGYDCPVWMVIDVDKNFRGKTGFDFYGVIVGNLDPTSTESTGIIGGMYLKDRFFEVDHELYVSALKETI